MPCEECLLCDYELSGLSFPMQVLGVPMLEQAIGEVGKVAQSKMHSPQAVATLQVGSVPQRLAVLTLL